MDKSQELFLMENYPTRGYKYCADFLGLKPHECIYKCRQLGLKVERKVRNKNLSDSIRKNNGNQQYKLNMGLFREIKEPDVAYFLGVIWADGCVRKTCMTLEVKEEDGIIYKNKFSKLGRFRTRIRQRKKNGKNFGSKMFSLSIFEKESVDFLNKMNYKNKSIESPTKILNHIPNNLHKYFWLGFLDGDGCIFVSKDKRARKLTFWGSFEQNWDDLGMFLKNIGVSYKIHVEIRKKTKHKCSRMEITKTTNIKKALDIFYQGHNLGLKRKRRKCEEIIKLYNQSEQIANSKESLKVLCKKFLEKGYNIKQISEKTNMSYHNCYYFIRKHVSPRCN